MDEQTVQLFKETRQPIAVTMKHPRRVDYEYERAGTASIFMFTEPLSDWRHASARTNKTKVEWAEEVTQLLDGRYASCEQVVRVCNNLNTHTRGAFYDAFPTAQARNYVRRLHFCHTPKHESWLNVAECELSALTRQCVSGCRFGDIVILRRKINAWSKEVNKHQRGVDWQTKIGYARRKLKSVYPKIKL